MTTIAEPFGPAPWGPHELYPDDVVDAHNRLVASVYGRYNGPGIQDPKPSFCRAESNRRLIMAAPEMLEALEAIIDSARDGRDIPEWLDERLVSAEAAIRKARGEQ